MYSLPKFQKSRYDFAYGVSRSLLICKLCFFQQEMSIVRWQEDEKITGTIKLKCDVPLTKVGKFSGMFSVYHDNSRCVLYKVKETRI